MSYRVFTTYTGGPVFATLEEANAFANEIMRNTGAVLLVSTTRAKVTHTYNLKMEIRQHV